MGHTRGLQLGQSTTPRLTNRGGFGLDMNCGRILAIPSLFRASCVVFLALAFTTSFGSSYRYIYYPRARLPGIQSTTDNTPLVSPPNGGNLPAHGNIFWQPNRLTNKKRNNDPLLNECIDRGGMERQLRSGNLNRYFSEMVNWLARCGRPRFGKRNGDENNNILPKNPEYNNEEFVPYMYNLN